jgi:hypothetical protein
MTQEQIMELLNRKIKEYTKKSEQNHWCDYYGGVVKGLKDAQSVIGMLDKQHNRI